MTSSFDGKTVLITGGSRGQGAAEGHAFARAGASVILCDVLDEEGEQAAREIVHAGGKAVYRRLDVTSVSDWRATAEYVVDQGSGLHALVNNAGIFHRNGRLMTTTPEDWDQMFAVNLRGPVLGIQTMAGFIRDSGGGSIVNTGSVAGVMGHLVAVYSATKWALRGVTKAAALELAEWNIRVNSIHPAMIQTAMVADATTAFSEAMKAHVPLGRSCTLDEIASLVMFLCSDAAGFITGIDVPIDGGYSELGTWWNVAQQAGWVTENHAMVADLVDHPTSASA
jgi:NAD(P)-dependent dehydrogenase (short-subunit alcohol dehydrogenase family)